MLAFGITNESAQRNKVHCKNTKKKQKKHNKTKQKTVKFDTISVLSEFLFSLVLITV